MNNTASILLVVLLSAVIAAGDYFIKAAGTGPKYMDYGKFAAGMAIYALSAFGWFYVMKHMKLSTLGVFFAVSSIIFLVFVGVVFFRERLSASEVVGIILGIVSIIILMRFS